MIQLTKDEVFDTTLKLEDKIQPLREVFNTTLSERNESVKSKCCTIVVL